MRPIVCATRGGQASRRTQERAIALAKERGTDLIFLCVADPSFVEVQDEMLAAALADELVRLGRSMVCIAQSRAQEQGLEAQTVVQCGPVWQTIEAFLRQVNAGTLVIGMPKDEARLRAFEPGEVHRFVETLRRNMDIEVIMVE